MEKLAELVTEAVYGAQDDLATFDHEEVSVLMRLAIVLEDYEVETVEDLEDRLSDLEAFDRQGIRP